MCKELDVLTMTRPIVCLHLFLFGHYWLPSSSEKHRGEEERKGRVGGYRTAEWRKRHTGRCSSRPFSVSILFFFSYSVPPFTFFANAYYYYNNFQSKTTTINNTLYVCFSWFVSFPHLCIHFELLSRSCLVSKHSLMDICWCFPA